jgi:ABC-type Na+ efflux pump permease subunit
VARWIAGIATCLATLAAVAGPLLGLERGQATRLFAEGMAIALAALLLLFAWQIYERRQSAVVDLTEHRSERNDDR